MREFHCQTGHVHWNLESVVKCDNKRIAARAKRTSARRQAEIDDAVRRGLGRYAAHAGVFGPHCDIVRACARWVLTADMPLEINPVLTYTADAWREQHP